MEQSRDQGQLMYYISMENELVMQGVEGTKGARAWTLWESPHAQSAGSVPSACTALHLLHQISIFGKVA